MRSKIKELSSLNSSTSNDEDTSPRKYYQLNFDESKIKLVENKIQLLEFLDEMEEKCRVADDGYLFIGCDTEWKPSCVLGMTDQDNMKAAIIQIATDNSIHLLDIIKLNEHFAADPQLSKAVIDRFITNKRIIKLGYGFTHDIRMIVRSLANSDSHDCTDLFRQTALELSYLVDHVI